MLLNLGAERTQGQIHLYCSPNE